MPPKLASAGTIPPGKTSKRCEFLDRFRPFSHLTLHLVTFSAEAHPSKFDHGPSRYALHHFQRSLQEICNTTTTLAWNPLLSKQFSDFIRCTTFRSIFSTLSNSIFSRRLPRNPLRFMPFFSFFLFPGNPIPFSFFCSLFLFLLSFSRDKFKRALATREKLYIPYYIQ